MVKRSVGGGLVGGVWKIKAVIRGSIPGFDSFFFFEAWGPKPAVFLAVLSKVNLEIDSLEL